MSSTSPLCGRISAKLASDCRVNHLRAHLEGTRPTNVARSLNSNPLFLPECFSRNKSVLRRIQATAMKREALLPGFTSSRIIPFPLFVYSGSTFFANQEVRPKQKKILLLTHYLWFSCFFLTTALETTQVSRILAAVRFPCGACALALHHQFRATTPPPLTFLPLFK